MNDQTNWTTARHAAGPASTPAGPGREGAVIRAFVDLSDELVGGYDLIDLLARLTTHCADLLDVASAGLLLADAEGVLHLAASSSERTHHLEMFQLQRDEGPCLDCFRDDEVVLVPDLQEATDRWPQFVEGAVLAGFASVHAVPMRLRGRVLGTLGLFGTEVGLLNDEDLALAQALTHVASVAIVNERTSADRDLVNAQLQHALTSRVVIEQAKGILAHSGGLDMADAFTALRSYARDHGRKLSDLAAQVVRREIADVDVLAHSRARVG